MYQDLSLPFSIMSSPDWTDYELLDSGNGAKLERFGDFILSRPEAEAIWQPTLPDLQWKKADACFISKDDKNGGYWNIKKKLPKRWQIDYKGLKCWLQLTASRHVGIFPEQACQWDWIQQQVKTFPGTPRVLNLFGYTGMATLAAAKAGAQVTHLDASKKAVSWARENQELSNLSQMPVRWLVDDALKFVQREKRRESYYDGILLDPPKFGRGPQGEVWEFYKLLPSLLHACGQILDENAQFMMITAYAVKASSITLRQSLQSVVNHDQEAIQSGEIVLVEKNGGRLLPTAIFANWSSKRSSGNLES